MRRGAPSSRGLQSVRGFTLVELLAVVVIMGILATVGLVALGRHRTAARSIEALAMLQSVRAAQERWKAEHMVYLDVTTDAGGWYPRDPTSVDAAESVQAFFYPAASSTHADNGRWLALRPTVTGPVLFGYRTNAGHAGEEPPEPQEEISLDWPDTTDGWYTIEAVGDVDWDGTSSYYLASSFDDRVLRVREGE